MSPRQRKKKEKEKEIETETETEKEKEKGEHAQTNLHWRSGEEDSALYRDRVQSHGGLVIRVLEPVSLVADEKVAPVGELADAAGVSAEALVGENEDVEEVQLHEAVDVLLDRLAVLLGDGEGLDGTGSQPLHELELPVLHEGAGAGDDDALAGGLAVGSEAGLDEGVDEGDGLERLA